jgi:hypothetical protein
MSDAEKTETNSNGGRQAKLTERCDLLPPAAILAVAGVLMKGAAKYGERNWRLITAREHLNHAIRHCFKWLLGDKSEPHLSHAACRIMMALEIDEVGMDGQSKQPKPAIEKCCICTDIKECRMTGILWQNSPAQIRPVCNGCQGKLKRHNQEIFELLDAERRKAAN